MNTDSRTRRSYDSDNISLAWNEQVATVMVARDRIAAALAHAIENIDRVKILACSRTYITPAKMSVSWWIRTAPNAWFLEPTPIIN